MGFFQVDIGKLSFSLMKMLAQVIIAVMFVIEKIIENNSSQHYVCLWQKETYREHISEIKEITI